MIIERSNINELVLKTGIKPDKDYGQNFLIDPSISERIVNELNIVDSDNVLEIGPGLGSLTNFMYEKSNLTLVDIDRRMTDFLSPIYKNNVVIINDDIRKVDVSKFNKIIGNLPYNITTELIIYLLFNAKKCSKFVLMCQQEAFDRFFETKGSAYGPASVLVHLLGDIKKILIAKPGSFYPSPKCNSLVFTLDIDLEVDRTKIIEVYKMTKSLFINRRKTIQNNLKSYLGSSEKTFGLLTSLNINPLTRPEEISPLKYLEMYNAIKGIK